jgi:Asp/Glu/hydantoin racemase
MPRIALIHAVYVAIEPIQGAFKALWPEAECVNLIDDALPADLERAGAMDPGIDRRIHTLATLAHDAGADAILFTCSAFGPAIEKVARALPIPVLKPNEAMFLAALEQGSRIGMLATFAPAVPPMEDEFRTLALSQGRPASIESFCVPDALAAAKGGDIPRHDRLVTQAAPRFAGFDAVLLAHFSTSTARADVEAALKRPVLTAPEAAVRLIQRRLAAA